MSYFVTLLICCFVVLLIIVGIFLVNIKRYSVTTYVLTATSDTVHNKPYVDLSLTVSADDNWQPGSSKILPELNLVLWYNTDSGVYINPDERELYSNIGVPIGLFPQVTTDYSFERPSEYTNGLLLTFKMDTYDGTLIQLGTLQFVWDYTKFVSSFPHKLVVLPTSSVYSKMLPSIIWNPPMLEQTLVARSNLYDNHMIILLDWIPHHDNEDNYISECNIEIKYKKGFLTLQKDSVYSLHVEYDYVGSLLFKPSDDENGYITVTFTIRHHTRQNTVGFGTIPGITHLGRLKFTCEGCLTADEFPIRIRASALTDKGYMRLDKMVNVDLLENLSYSREFDKLRFP